MAQELPDPAPLPADEAVPPAMIKADLAAGIFFVVLATATLVGSWTMDRLEARRINPMTAPGLVPGLLSAALLVCGIILTLRSLRSPAPGGWRELGSAVVSSAAQRAGAVLVLTLTYTLVLVACCHSGWPPGYSSLPLSWCSKPGWQRRGGHCCR